MSDNDCEGRRATARKNPMKAITASTAGSRCCSWKTAQSHAPQDDEVLVRVRALALNPYDKHFLHGTPYFMRFARGCSTRRSPASAWISPAWWRAWARTSLGSSLATRSSAATSALAEYLVIAEQRTGEEAGQH